MWRFVFPMLALVLFLVSLARSHPLDTLPPGQWYTATGTTLKRVAYPWPADVTYTINGVGVAGVIDSWAGGAYDTDNEQLLIVGGGHYAYAGNEVYAFDMATLQWQRLSDPGLRTDTENRLWASGEYPDAHGQPDPHQPRGNHTYNTLQYVPALHQLCNIGKPGVFPAAGSSRASHCFDRTARQWHRMAPTLGTGLQAWSVRDPVTGNIWTHGTNLGKRTLLEWNPLTDLWAIRGKQDGRYVTRNSTAAFDAVRNLIVTIGGGQMVTYDVRQMGLLTPTIVQATGDVSIVSAQAPGLDYHARAQRLVAWSGGAYVYVLDTDGHTWHRIQPAPGNVVVPGVANRNGTYGRWRYVPTYDVFVVVSGVTQPVYIYRLAY